MSKKTISRIIAALLASVSVFAFAACDTEGGAGDGTDVGNGGIIDSGSGSGSDNNNGSDDNNSSDDGNGNGGSVKPPEPVIPTVPAGSVQITKAAGDLEAAYVIWDKVDGAMSYNVYVKGESGDYTQLDAPLVREYKNYCRADAVGLKAGTYSFKVVPTGGAEYTEDEGKAATATDIAVSAHDRSGYAFVGGTSSGAYNEDGTLRANAKVLYVTNDNYKKVSVSYGGTTVTGIDNILGEGYQEKKGATDPLCVRIIGSIGNGNKIDFKANGDLELKALHQGVTVEGIGSDATANGWGMHITSCSNIEIRNLAFMTMKGGTKDGVGFESGCHHVWTHNCDFFYGHNWGGDQKKGDGSLDTKDTTYVTHSYNHFWDSGKCNLQGMESSGDYRVTYHHNWYDHSDSRHPRIRVATAHIYNNYFDGNAKYGVGATNGSSVFVENNYFRSTAQLKPMMISMQGTDTASGTDTANKTFSSENGGIIKSYGNEFDCVAGKLKLIERTSSSPDGMEHFDCYAAATRDEKVPSTVKTLKGGTTYNNFDTASDFYEYSVDTPEVAKEKVEKYAGRIDGGDLEFDFDDAKEDANYDIIPELSALLQNYSSDLVKIGGDAASGGSSSGGSTGGNEGGESGGTLPDNVNKIEFISDNDGKYPAGITVNGNYDSKTGYLKMESSTSVTVKVEKETKIVVHTNGSSGQGIKLNGTKTTLDGNGECSITIAAGGTLTIEKGDKMQLMYIQLS